MKRVNQDLSWTEWKERTMSWLELKSRSLKGAWATSIQSSQSSESRSGSRPSSPVRGQDPHYPHLHPDGSPTAGCLAKHQLCKKLKQATGRERDWKQPSQGVTLQRVCSGRQNATYLTQNRPTPRHCNHHIAPA